MITSFSPLGVSPGANHYELLGPDENGRIGLDFGHAQGNIEVHNDRKGEHNCASFVVDICGLKNIEYIPGAGVEGWSELLQAETMFIDNNKLGNDSRAQMGRLKPGDLLLYSDGSSDDPFNSAIHFSVAATDLRNGRLVVASVVGYRNPIGISSAAASRLLPDQPENRLIRVSTLRTAP